MSTNGRLAPSVISASAALMAIALAAPASASDESTADEVSLKDQPTRYCREMNNASSRMYAMKVCKTRAEWRRWEACHGSVTRYCTPKRKALELANVGRETAFPLNDSARIICKQVKVTGSHILSEEMCMPKREWDRMWVETSEGLQKLQNNFSTMPNKEVRDAITPR